MIWKFQMYFAYLREKYIYNLSGTNYFIVSSQSTENGKKLEVKLFFGSKLRKFTKQDLDAET